MMISGQIDAAESYSLSSFEPFHICVFVFLIWKDRDQHTIAEKTSFFD